MEIMQLARSATKKECNTKKVQHEKITTLKKCNMKKETRVKYGKKKMHKNSALRVRKWVKARPLTDRYTLVFSLDPYSPA